MEYNFIVWLKNMICLFLTVLKQFLLTERTHSWSWRVPQTLGKLWVPGSTWASGAHKRHFCQALRWAIYQTTVEVGSKIESACDQYGFFWERLLPHKIYLNFQSSAAAIQLLLGSFAELCVLDDLEGTGKENRIALGDYEGKTSWIWKSFDWLAFVCSHGIVSCVRSFKHLLG